MKIREFWDRYKRNRLGAFGLIVLISIFLTAIFAPFIAPHSPWALNVGPRLKPPAVDYPMGTDDLGRDILSQVIWGCRISLFVGFVASLLTTLIGIIAGALAGYYGGYIDIILMRITDVIIVLPTFVLALMMVSLYGNSFYVIVVVIATTGWTSTARLVRAEYLTHKERAYVESARSIGITDINIILGEILPNAMPPIIVNASIGVSRAILLEAGLSFLGAGDPSVISWGYMLSNAFKFIHISWWMITVPGFALFLTALSLNLIGDALNDALNPRLKHI